MTFDEYFDDLINRVHLKHAILAANEAFFYRLSSIMGETNVDGIEAYFERRFDEFDADMNALSISGFDDLVADYNFVRRLICGDLPLTEELVIKGVEQLENAGPDIKEQFSAVRSRVLKRLEDVEDFRDEYGRREGFYESCA